MTSPDNTCRTAAQPSVPSRSSSISATRRGRSRNTSRSSRAVEDTAEPFFLRDFSFSMSCTPVQSRSPARSPQPSRMNARSVSCAPSARAPLRPARVQRWAGLTRSVTNWDDLRRDNELWSEDGDCDVHLCARGASRRGPSFRVPLRALRQKHCNAMLSVCYAQAASGTSSEGHEGRLESFDNVNRGPHFVDLYIPAPESTSREDSFDWHVTTRNFFAFVMGKPLVGKNMGQTFVKLQERMNLFRSDDVNNQQDFLQYIEEQGYRDLVECTDYALASLHYAEHYKLRPVWIDAFAHCVGMNDSLPLSPEYTSISKLTKALIQRAYLEVDIHLGDVATALRVFLQDDFSPAYIGLTDGARSHMDRFRRFLHHYYVEKFGYWPPPRSTTAFPKALYKSMFFDFKNLYEYLADTTSTTDINAQRPAIGGFCVLQNLDSFDKRHKFTSQPHPLPLLPVDTTKETEASSSRISRSFSSSSHAKKAWKSRSKSAALTAAANLVDPNVVNSRIVQSYMQFEKTYASSSNQKEERISSIDARKVRWLVIYGTLQYLTSALRAPKEVRDVEGADYALCCLVAPQSSWAVSSPVTTPSAVMTPQTPRAIDDYFGDTESSPSVGIQPDCQRDDYFSSQRNSRSESVDVPAPLKPTQPSRQFSTRSFGPLSSLSARSSRRNSLKFGSNSIPEADRLQQMTSTPPPELDDASTEVPWLNPRTAPVVPEEYETVSAPSVRGHSRQRTPLLQTTQLDDVRQATFLDDSSDIMSRSDSTSSMASSVWTDGGSAASSKSSADGERFYKASAAEYSGLLGGLVSMSGSPVRLEAAPNATSGVQSNVHPLLRDSPSPAEGFEFDFNNQQAGSTPSTRTSVMIRGTASPTPASSTPTQQSASPAPTPKPEEPINKSEKPIG